jgi:hypothetical protein
MTMQSAVVGVAMLAAGCAPMPTVALDATPGDLEILAGEWVGEYESAALGRSGQIEFKLAAGTDDARGDVLMIPRGSPVPYQRRQYQDTRPDPISSSTELLTIRFIRASTGSITGVLDRYWDPDRNCFANTAFRGNVALGLVQGTFKTTFECGAGEATGTWSATKKRAKPSAGWR